MNQLKSMSIKEQLRTITDTIVLTEQGNLLLNSIEDKKSVFSDDNTYRDLFDKFASDILETVERVIRTK